MLVVLDTNLLVSALWSRDGAPAKVVAMAIGGALVPCFDYRIMTEYREVLQRPKFGFSKGEINSLLLWFESHGHSVIAPTLKGLFIDEGDRKFYEVAKFCHSPLITGNLRHFPKDPMVLGVQDFLERYGAI